MDVLAALGDAPTAAIAIVAILLAVFFAVRGQRGERGAVAAAGAADEAAPTLLKVPVAPADPAPDADADGLRTMAVGEVGHGAIRLGRPEAPGRARAGARAEAGGPGSRAVSPQPQLSPRPSRTRSHRPRPARRRSVKGRSSCAIPARTRPLRSSTADAQAAPQRTERPQCGRSGCFPDGTFAAYAASRSPASAGSSPRVRIAVSSS